MPRPELRVVPATTATFPFNGFMYTSNNRLVQRQRMGADKRIDTGDHPFIHIYPLPAIDQNDSNPQFLLPQLDALA